MVGEDLVDDGPDDGTERERERGDEDNEGDECDDACGCGATRSGTACVGVLHEVESNADCQERRCHSDEAGQKERTAAKSIDVDNGNQRGQNIHSANGPGCCGGLIFGCRETGFCKNFVGVIDDGVDAGDLLEDSEANTDREWLAEFLREDLGPCCFFGVVFLRSLFDFCDLCCGIDVGTNFTEGLDCIVATTDLHEPTR